MNSQPEAAAEALPDDRGAGEAADGRGFGCLAVILSIIMVAVSALVWDLYPLLTLSAREKNLKRHAAIGQQWHQVKPKLEQQQYHLMEFGTSPPLARVELTQRFPYSLTYFFRLAAIIRDYVPLPEKALTRFRRSYTRARFCYVDLDNEGRILRIYHR